MRKILAAVSFVTAGFSVGCASGLVQTSSDAEKFISQNQVEITTEMAKGDGEKLRTLAELTGCDSEESKQAFISMTKDSYDKIVRGSNTSSQELVSNLRKQMMADEEVALLCDTASL